MKRHVVQQGDHISGIADRYGFRDPQTIWTHADNVELASRRKNPHILAPGDEIVIPERVENEVSGATGRRHVFVVRRKLLKLRLRLLNVLGQPRANTQVELDVDGVHEAATTDADGCVEREIPVTARRCTLTNGDIVAALMIGDLNPVDEPFGVEGRLNNLGYDADDDPDDLRFFLDCFQRDRGHAVTEDPAEVAAQLEEAHGC